MNQNNRKNTKVLVVKIKRLLKILKIFSSVKKNLKIMVSDLISCELSKPASLSMLNLRKVSVYNNLLRPNFNSSQVTLVFKFFCLKN